jgi:putative addiction module component (TIGR02574 family)
MKLPDRERLGLAHELWESVPSGAADLDDLDENDGSGEELSPEWREEIDRRIRELDEGRTKPIPFDDVLAEARARLNAKPPKPKPSSQE